MFDTQRVRDAARTVQGWKDWRALGFEPPDETEMEEVMATVAEFMLYIEEEVWPPLLETLQAFATALQVYLVPAIDALAAELGIVFPPIPRPWYWRAANWLDERGLPALAVMWWIREHSLTLRTAIFLLLLSTITILAMKALQ